MFWILLALVPLFVLPWSIYRHVKNGSTYGEVGGKDVSYVLLGISIAILAAGFIFQLANYSRQISDGEELAKIERFEEIYQKKADALTKQFAYYLADIYPDHEKNIFEDISPEGIDIYLVKYPELRASETIVHLVSEIKILQNDFYNQQLAREEVIRDMLYKIKSPWIVQWFMPDVEM